MVELASSNMRGSGTALRDPFSPPGRVQPPGAARRALRGHRSLTRALLRRACGHAALPSWCGLMHEVKPGCRRTASSAASLASATLSTAPSSSAMSSPAASSRSSRPRLAPPTWQVHVRVHVRVHVHVHVACHVRVRVRVHVHVHSHVHCMDR